MTNIDQFESVFKAASRTPFRFQSIRPRSLLVVTDMSTGGEGFANAVQTFLSSIAPDGGWQTSVLAGDQFDTVGRLLELVEAANPDLICTYRNLHTMAWKWPHSLGDYLDVLTQVARPPVLVVPHPSLRGQLGWIERSTQTVMAITDHLAGDHYLVNYAAAMTQSAGTLLLSHVEDEAALWRILDAIAKIPELDTDVARQQIPQQLLKEPHDYIGSCREVLQQHDVRLEIQEVVTLGHFLADHMRIVQQQDVDLLVLNTKDDDQAAMHGLAYPLTVELRSTPLLLL